MATKNDAISKITTKMIIPRLSTERIQHPSDGQIGNRLGGGYFSPLSWPRRPFPPVRNIFTEPRIGRRLFAQPILGAANQLLLCFQRERASHHAGAQKDEIRVERVAQAIVIDLC